MADGPLVYVVTLSAASINLQVKTMAPFARHLCCSVEDINANAQDICIKM